ncbi:hypothetical protein GCM10025886_14040 [Tetragenococcus halophilus subsp. flandriensis]|nr:hypothetical protein GCM10025886_14040 [Tetragenococcus halophilus subsp. flandriensis]
MVFEMFVEFFSYLVFVLVVFILCRLFVIPLMLCMDYFIGKKVKRRTLRNITIVLFFILALLVSLISYFIAYYTKLNWFEFIGK